MLDRLLAPIVEDEELAVKARALNLLTLVTALVTVVYALVTVVIAPAELSLVVIAALAVALAACLGCYWLSRRGRVRLAGYIFFVGLFAAISFYMTASASTISDLTMAPFLYILVVLPSGYVLQPRVSFISRHAGHALRDRPSDAGAAGVVHRLRVSGQLLVQRRAGLCPVLHPLGRGLGF